MASIADNLSEDDIVALYWQATENAKTDRDKAHRALWSSTADTLRPLLRRCHYRQEQKKKATGDMKLTNNSLHSTVKPTVAPTVAPAGSMASMLEQLTGQTAATVPTASSAPSAKPVPPAELTLRAVAKTRIENLTAWAKNRGCTVLRGRKNLEAVSPADCAISGKFTGMNNGQPLAMLPLPSYFTADSIHAKDNRVVWLDVEQEIIYLAVRVDGAITALTVTNENAQHVSSVLSTTKPLVARATAGRSVLRRLYLGDVHVELNVDDYDVANRPDTVKECAGDYLEMLKVYQVAHQE